jgi:hypothetical protein
MIIIHISVFSYLLDNLYVLRCVLHVCIGLTVDHSRNNLQLIIHIHLFIITYQSYLTYICVNPLVHIFTTNISSFLPRRLQSLFVSHRPCLPCHYYYRLILVFVIIPVYPVPITFIVYPFFSSIPSFHFSIHDT